LKASLFSDVIAAHHMFPCLKLNRDEVRNLLRTVLAVHFECEQVFFNVPVVAGEDEKHSENENRFYVLGQTDSGRLLFLVFTVRKDRLRVISARDMNKKERRAYQTHEEENSAVQE
jgi:uncharacterized DUF497 family protein